MLMEKDINCINFKGLFAHLERHHGTSAVEAVIRGLIDNPAYQIQDKLDPDRLMPVQRHHLVDSAYWVSNDFSLQLLGNVNAVDNSDNPLFNAGIGAVHAGLSKSALFAGKLLGPSALIRRVAHINRRFNRTKEVVVTRHEPQLAIVELHYHDGIHVTRDVCNWNLGIYTGLARLSGVRRVRSAETRCVLNGDPCCEFRLEWRRAGWFRRLYRGLLVWLVREDIRQMIDEHEATLNERDQLINRLVRSEEKYRTLFEDSMEAMNLTQNGRICDVNPAWLRLHGFLSKADVIGRDVLEFIHPDDRFILSQRRGQWPHLPNRMFQIRDIRHDGSAVDVEVYSTRLTVSGDVMILATIRDVSSIHAAERERRQLERRLQRVEKMEAMGTLVGGVAHDLNNILSGIVSYPELLLMQLPEDSPLRQPMETIHATGKKAAAIVNDLLTMARRGVTVTEVINVNAVIDGYLNSPEAAKMLSYHPSVTIAPCLDEHLGHIHGSPLHINKTVMNLVANAAEAMPDGGIVRIATQNCVLDRPLSGYDAIPPGRYVRLTVADTGSGIAAEDLRRIFEPFYTKKKMGRSGTGLGMSVVWGTVKDHRGFIDVRSRPGAGTTFTLYFPMTEAPLTDHGAEDAIATLRGGGQRILVVDDSQAQREIATRILESLGYAADAVASGEAAVDYLAKRSVDLVILDMIMDPGMDGLETYQRILAMHPHQRALIASGFSETDRVKAAQRIGAGVYVRKPYTLETIARAVHRVLAPPPDGDR